MNWQTTGHGAVRPGKSPNSPAKHSLLGATCVAAAMAALPWQAAYAAPGWDGTHDRDLSGWELRLSPYTYHFHYDSEHKNVYLAALTKVDEEGWMAGAAAFSNSFGQPSGYVFAGRKYVEPWGWDRVYWSWTAGVIYGYRPPYNHKVPLNDNGWSPGLVPSVGYQFTPTLSAEIALLGTAGFMLNFALQLK